MVLLQELLLVQVQEQIQLHYRWKRMNSQSCTPRNVPNLRSETHTHARKKVIKRGGGKEWLEPHQRASLPKMPPACTWSRHRCGETRGTQRQNVYMRCLGPRIWWPRGPPPLCRTAPRPACRQNRCYSPRRVVLLATKWEGSCCRAIGRYLG